MNKIFGLLFALELSKISFLVNENVAHIYNLYLVVTFC
jgi:hypothetical protein